MCSGQSGLDAGAGQREGKSTVFFFLVRRKHSTEEKQKGLCEMSLETSVALSTPWGFIDAPGDLGAVASELGS